MEIDLINSIRHKISKKFVNLKEEDQMKKNEIYKSLEELEKNIKYLIKRNQN